MIPIAGSIVEGSALDAPLPKLIFGEVWAPDVERFMEVVA